MAQYHYDEAGNMAAYFVVTFLTLVLIPLTFSLATARPVAVTAGCDCELCVDQRRRQRRTVLNPKLASVVAAGWSLLAFVVYKIGTTPPDSSLYDPFSILGIKPGMAEKEIKRHYKLLSIQFHPDKVKLAANQTLELVQEKFIEITKAYKSLTDANIRENWEKYGHPDGKQEFSVGIAIPKWIVESQNNIWVLAVYGVIFGGALPMLVGRWWFGSRQNTKDGVKGKTAEQFFKAVREESSVEDMLYLISAAWERESSTKKTGGELQSARQKIDEELGGPEWREKSSKDPSAEHALTLLYAHFLHLKLPQKLELEQRALLLHTPALLSSLLAITLAHSWLPPALSAMRLHALLAQALRPGAPRLMLLPGVGAPEVAGLPPRTDFAALVRRLDTADDERASQARAIAARWGALEIVDAYYKVIGEKIVTPGAIVQLVFRLRVVPPLAPSTDITEATHDEERDATFLSGKGDAEALPIARAPGWAHAPFWPMPRKAQWWALVGDPKLSRVVVPPLRVADVPLGGESRAYKVQFQAPAAVGTYAWRLLLVSDTFPGEEAARDLVLRVEDVSVLGADADPAEDEISDPDEDTLAGQMAAMRGGRVKKRVAESEEDESTTDGESGSDSDSSSSDSD